jgi:ABC-type sugar transport system ATPase subunit
MKNITKVFPGVKALDNVNFKAERGEIHAIVGENGAGKSTLMKVLSGVYPHGNYDGEIIYNNEVQTFNHIKDSEHKGIAIIYQELALVKEMSIAENIFLGNEHSKRGVINWNRTAVETVKVLKEVGLSDNPQTKVINLGVGKQQLVEIAKAISKNVSLLILDEPTAALNETESANLLNIIRALKAKGVTCIYISHKLEEVLDIADTITVLRDGQTIETKVNDESITEEVIISMMVGRTLDNRFPRVSHTPGETVLEVNNWTVYSEELHDKKVVDNVSFKARKGEIVGIAGLMGAGRTELAMSLFGAYGHKQSGTIKINGKEVIINSPKDAINHGFCYLTEDRKVNGLVLMMDVLENITLASLDKVSKNGALNVNEEIKYANEYVKALNIKTPSIEQKVNNLSGGNQQKVAVAKWLMASPDVLILDEPTRGIDVGAKWEIYNIMNELVEKGVSIIIISSELPEILGMSDRVLVIHNGKLTGEIDFTEATQEKVMHYATGGK